MKNQNRSEAKVPKEESSELEKTKKDLAEMTELAKRTMADLINLKRRQEEEKSTWISLANADLIKSLLPILDNFERAVPHIPKDTGEWFKGIQMSFNQLKKIVQDAGVIEIKTVGEKFNSDLHEAVTQSAGEKDIVIEELEKGYTLGNRILRHAKVKVGNGEKTP